MKKETTLLNEMVEWIIMDGEKYSGLFCKTLHTF